MRIPPLIVVAIAGLLLAGCASTRVADDAVATYLLVRHAEKDTSVASDPPLTAAGHARAQRLAEQLRNTPLDAIYSSSYRRTRQTATPVADAHRLAIVDYDPADAAAFAARLRGAHPRGQVLVVGHSNTLPPLASALCGCAVADMDEAIYGIRYTLRFDADGNPRLTEIRE